jgi:hypothetical protein
LELENVGVPTRHVSELDLNLEPSLLEIRAESRGWSSRSVRIDYERMNVPVPSPKLLIEVHVHGFLIDRQEQVALRGAALATLHSALSAVGFVGIQ